MSVKVGDAVKYRILDRTLNAIVLAVRSGEVSHRGANDEPLLTLAFADPVREKMIAPQKKLRVLPEVTQAQVFIECDVVHYSHEFDEEFLKTHGNSPAQIASQRGHGEWEELNQSSDLKQLVADQRVAYELLLKQRDDLVAQIASAPADEETAD